MVPGLVHGKRTLKGYLLEYGQSNDDDDDDDDDGDDDDDDDDDLE